MSCPSNGPTYFYFSIEGDMDKLFHNEVDKGLRLEKCKVVIYEYNLQYNAVQIKRGQNVCYKYAHNMLMFVSENKREYFMWDSGLFSALSEKKLLLFE